MPAPNAEQGKLPVKGRTTNRQDDIGRGRGGGGKQPYSEPELSPRPFPALFLLVRHGPGGPPSKEVSPNQLGREEKCSAYLPHSTTPIKMPNILAFTLEEHRPALTPSGQLKLTA